MDEYLAMIKMFAGTFCPRGFMYCQGQLLSISTNTALFALLGTTYGGNGQTTFALPDLRGRIPVGTGQGGSVSPIQLGEMAGSESVTILSSQMPAHTHSAQVTVAPPVNIEAASAETPDGAYSGPAGSQIYSSTATAGVTGAAYQAQATIGIAGGSQPLPIRNPYLGMNYIICTSGLFPSRD